MILLASTARAQTSYPMVSRTHPVAIQRGSSAEVTIGGQGDLGGATAILFDVPGLTAEVVAEPAPKPAAPVTKGKRVAAGLNVVRFKISAKPDTPLGPREFRLVTPRGASSVGQIVVVSDPVVVEDDILNDNPAVGQPIPLPVAVAGVVGKIEDVDWYTFRPEAGQTVVFSLWGNRLEDKIHDLQTHLDPILQLYDEAGRELAANDNHHFADPLLAYTFKSSGVYKIAVRDTTYDGNPNWSYVLQATTGPYAATASPMAVHPGATAELSVTGLNLDASKLAKVVVPADARPGPIALELATDRGMTPPVPLVATTLPIATEAGDAPAEFAKAQGADLPVALSGRLGERNDRDGYRFEVKKGMLYRFEVTARRAGSEADPVLRLLNQSGKTLAEADDTFGKDPSLEWTALADGLVMAVVRDLHDRGGPGFGYVLEVEAARPDFVVTCDPDKVNVGPGARGPVFVKVERRGGFAGPVEIGFEGLPAGVSASPLTIPAGATQGLSVVSASADANLGATLAKARGRATSTEGAIVREATPREEIYMPGGGRGLYSVATLPVCVTEPSDITVESAPAEIVLKPGGSATVDVTIARHGGFAGAVNLSVALEHLGQVYAATLPPGVTVKADASKTRIAPEGVKGTIVLEAAPAAAAGSGTICVMGHVSINFVVKTAYCSGPIAVRVEKP